LQPLGCELAQTIEALQIVGAIGTL